MIEDARDPRLQLFANVGDAELLRGHGLFVAEGRLIVQRVLADARFRVRAVLVNPATARELAPTLEATSAPVHVAHTGVFERLTGFNLHRGCLALVERPAAAALSAVSNERLLVAVDGLSDADNVGGVFRNAAAFGAGGVLLDSGSCDPFYRKAVRTSMGAVLHVPFVRSTDLAGSLKALQSAGFLVIALTPREPCHDLDDVVGDLRGSRVALVVGNEGTGVSDAVIELADHAARIPMTARVDSLNVAVAAGIALYRLSGR